MDLSVVLPTYNEKNNIVNLVNQILEVIKNIENKEIIIKFQNSKLKSLPLAMNL